MDWLIDLARGFLAEFSGPDWRSTYFILGSLFILAAFIVLAYGGDEYRKVVEKKGASEEDKRNRHKELMSDLKWFFFVLFLAGILILCGQGYTLLILVSAVLIVVLIFFIRGLCWTGRNVFFALKNLKYK